MNREKDHREWIVFAWPANTLLLPFSEWFGTVSGESNPSSETEETGNKSIESHSSYHTKRSQRSLTQLVALYGTIVREGTALLQRALRI